MDSWCIARDMLEYRDPVALEPFQTSKWSNTRDLLIYREGHANKSTLKPFQNLSDV